MKIRKINPKYLELRKKVFNTQKEDLKLTNRDEASIYGVAVDIVVKERVLTMVCWLNGKADIYISDKDGYFRDSGKFEAIQRSSTTFLLNVGQIFESFEKTTDFSVNADYKENVFLITTDGIYNAPIAKKTNDLKFLRFLYKKTLAKIIDTHSYSCMEQSCRTCVLGDFFGINCLMKKALEQ